MHHRTSQTHASIRPAAQSARPCSKPPSGMRARKLLSAAAVVATVLFVLRPPPAPPRRITQPTARHQQPTQPTPVLQQQTPAIVPVPARAAPTTLIEEQQPRRELLKRRDPSCTRVHVYNASQLDVESLRAHFGVPISASDRGGRWLTTSDQHALGGMLLSRLLRARTCPLVAPEHAEVFVVPLLYREIAIPTRQEMDKVHDFMPPTEQDSIKATCRRMVDTDWTKALHPHLTPSTAYRHIFIHEKFFGIAGFCRGVMSNFGERLASNPTLTSWAWGDNTVTPMGGPRAFSFAYPSAVHLSRADIADGMPPPWAPNRFGKRPYLMMFGGSMHGHPLAKRLRTFLREQCANYSEPDCRLVSAEQMPGVLDAAMDAKTKATFCLEPPGYGDERKAVADALTLGCIPVTFVREVETRYWPHHWDAQWRDESHVFIDHEDVLSGRVDVRERLRAIPPAEIARMQATIGKFAWRIHYQLDEFRAPQPDAVELVWRTLAQAAGREVGAVARREATIAPLMELPESTRSSAVSAPPPPLAHAGDEVGPEDESFL